MKTFLSESRSGGLKPNGDGTYNVVLITAGRGSSGLYSESLLREFGPQAFPAGTHSYVDHPTEQNPGRSPEKLLGVFMEAAHWDDSEGGLVSRFKPMKHYREFVEEVAPYTGLSIYAQGEGLEEDVEGESVFVVKELLPNVMNTVDLVSYAGRGGHFAEALLESALEFSQDTPGANERGNENMALEDEVKNLISVVASAVSELTTAREALATATTEVEATKVDASTAVESAIAAARMVEEAELPDTVKDSFRAQIDAGHYDVKPAIEAASAIRDSVLADAAAKAAVVEKDTLAESFGFLGSPRHTVAEELIVDGWNN